MLERVQARTQAKRVMELELIRLALTYRCTEKTLGVILAYAVLGSYRLHTARTNTV